MVAIFFDVDDTLYDQLLPFERAFKKQFPQFQIDIEELYKKSRILSDSVFELSEAGKISSDDMKVYRIQEACRQIGIHITREQSVAFQLTYEVFQKEITLSDTMKAILDYCKNANAVIGIITNGPSSHQEMKIHQLNLSRWVPANRIIISSQVGVAKPNMQIFEIAKRQLDNPEEQILYYIGDNFTNDVKGADDAGWRTIWLNKRQHRPNENLPINSFMVHNEEQLLSYIKRIL
ncbi:UNVERIFIED_CONTAM: HAD family hydrolase [Streptococcus canis]|uniref:HAD family hydrolase n=1 Tax=Streptococcus canis TaxID=1329 RepID=UPI0012F3890B|nr:HAD family hydrolase [Streptococcus canis]MDW7796783.1 HAD family hydrolase [Streptococcus canis]GFE44040.1 hydrolase [Streptococcus canis]GFE46470.1 hydrolase [Streptococcus canis]GFG43838.1 hydrolase [Streptococcus canis]